MMRRDSTSTLHRLMLILTVARRGESAVLSREFDLSGLVQVVVALAVGRLNAPGPKLKNHPRAAYPGLQWSMYALLAWTALATWGDATRLPLPGPDSTTPGFWLFGGACLHGAFHFWRHNILGDGAVRQLLPAFAVTSSQDA